MNDSERPELKIEFEDAEAYFGGRLHSGAWVDAGYADQRKAIGWAARILDGAYAWRDGACDVYADGSVLWDRRIIAAVCEQAIWLLKTDPTHYPELLTLGIAEGAAGASAKFDRSFVAPLICDAAKALIGDIGILIGSDGVVQSAFLGG